MFDLCGRRDILAQFTEAFSTRRIGRVFQAPRWSGGGDMEHHEKCFYPIVGCSLDFDTLPSPAVPEGRQLLRTSYMATHTDEQMSRIIEQ